MAADRAPFVDQSQSMNIYMKEPTIGKVTSSHFHAFEKGLKTGCYYFKTQSASEGAKHLAIDMSNASANTLSNQANVSQNVAMPSVKKEVVSSNKPAEPSFEEMPQKPADSPFECFGCSS